VKHIQSAPCQQRRGVVSDGAKSSFVIQESALVSSSAVFMNVMKGKATETPRGVTSSRWPSGSFKSMRLQREEVPARTASR